MPVAKKAARPAVEIAHDGYGESAALKYLKIDVRRAHDLIEPLTKEAKQRQDEHRDMWLAIDALDARLKALEARA